MEFNINYNLTDKDGKEIGKGEGKIKIDEENFLLQPKLQESLALSFRDILEIIPENYKIQLILAGQDKLILTDLGYEYESFLKNLFKFRNEVLIKDLLMEEGLKKSNIQAEFSHREQKGICEIRLYETALVVLPEKGEIIRIPYGEIKKIEDKDYQITILIEEGETIIFSQLGENFELAVKTLSELVNKLSLEVQQSLKELLPQVEPLTLMKIARLMKEGRAAQRKDIEAVSPQLWQELEKKLEIVGAKEEYDFLAALSQKDKICLGFKKGLMGGLTGDYLWFLIPIYNNDTAIPGNVLAMEAASEGETGRATYFFRIVGRKDYPKFKNLDELHKLVDDFIKQMNKAMIEINFRREPIYLSEEKLNDPQYAKYKFSIAKLPSLQILRSHFIGRVIHTSPEQWQEDVRNLLKFNISETDDNKKWQKIEIIPK